MLPPMLAGGPAPHEADETTREFYLSAGEPCIVAYELHGREAAMAALCELAASDLLADDMTVEIPIFAPPRACVRQRQALLRLNAELAELAPELFC